MVKDTVVVLTPLKSHCGLNSTTVTFYLMDESVELEDLSSPSLFPKVTLALSYSYMETHE